VSSRERERERRGTKTSHGRREATRNMMKTLHDECSRDTKQGMKEGRNEGREKTKTHNQGGCVRREGSSESQSESHSSDCEPKSLANRVDWQNMK